MFVDFLKILGMTLGLAWLLVLGVSVFLMPSILLRETLIGCLLPVVCFIPGFYAVSQTVQSSWKMFLIAVFGGMFMRLVCIATVFMLLVMLTRFHVSTLLFSLVGFYTLCLAVELYFVSQRIASKKHSF
jgi:hypothetical protein